MLLLDTDVMIDVMREHEPALQWIGDMSVKDVVLPGYVAMELIQECRDKAELHTLRSEIEQYRIIWPQPETCDRALVSSGASTSNTAQAF